MESIYICGKPLEVIETFEYHVLVQDPVTLVTQLIEYQHIDQVGEVKSDDVPESNIISLKGRTWLRKINDGTKKPRRLTSVVPKVLPMAR